MLISVCPLASAAVGPSSDSDLQLILIGCGVVAITGILGFVPFQIARVRSSRNHEGLAAFLILWGLITAGSICYAVMKQMDWSIAYQQRLVTGYADPFDVSDKPAKPIGLWCGLGVVYVVLNFWAMRGPPVHRD